MARLSSLADERTLLEVAVRYGYTSGEAFARAGSTRSAQSAAHAAMIRWSSLPSFFTVTTIRGRSTSMRQTKE
ncbi:hypothetical protein [Streptomyces sp. NPDC002205]|uniref:hypothetical protein n=1 Tax=Streptomyces sp. NPDC002205 TaxID=3154411 RepID=UPI00332DBE9F